MKSRTLVVAVGILGLVSVFARADQRAPRVPTSMASFVGLTVSGINFAAFPNPYARVQIHSTTTSLGPNEEGAMAGVSSEVGLTVAEARALGEALIAWADNPQHTPVLFERTREEN